MSAHALLAVLQDAVLRMWKAHFETALRALAADKDNDSFQRQTEIRHHIASLKTWDTGQDIIGTELAVMGETAGEAS